MHGLSLPYGSYRAQNLTGHRAGQVQVRRLPKSAPHGPGDTLLLIEVSDSTLRYDLEVKARLYATHGILEYWVVDLVSRRVVRYRAPNGAQYAQVDEITAATVELLVGEIEVDLSDLW